MPDLKKSVYCFQWRPPNWLAGPCFLVGGVALLGLLQMLSDPPPPLAPILSLALALAGATLTSRREGFDYSPLDRSFSRWSSCLGLRKKVTGVVSEACSLTLQQRTGGNVAVLLVLPESESIEVLACHSQAQAQKMAERLAAMLRLKLSAP